MAETEKTPQEEIMAGPPEPDERARVSTAPGPGGPCSTTPLQTLAERVRRTMRVDLAGIARSSLPSRSIDWIASDGTPSGARDLKHVTDS
ncbi:MAG: hypothetical protein WKF30_16705, partial [Pyrinomonadaceae bacterium]